jgi:hypothetical protein
MTKGSTPFSLDWCYEPRLKWVTLLPWFVTRTETKGGDFCHGSCYQPGLKGVSTHGISGHVDETPLVPAPKLNRD